MVGTEDISLLEAQRKFTLVHLPDGKFLVRRSLKHCERRLPEERETCQSAVGKYPTPAKERCAAGRP